MIFLNNLLPINEENIYSNYGMLLSVNLDPGRSYGKKAYFKLVSLYNVSVIIYNFIWRCLNVYLHTGSA